ncbi:MAG: alpha/beta fold hydrolase [Deltaproteobacteria bacterium]|nr:alpha/beta fold hydrolase [Deltaproteobacteria bacterium]
MKHSFAKCAASAAAAAFVSTLALGLTAALPSPAQAKHPIPNVLIDRPNGAPKSWQRPAKAPPVRIPFADPAPAGRAGGIARTTGFATARDGTRLYYEKIGSGPALVFIHGLGGNHAAWFHQVPVFAQHFTVITLSQRGFAPSTGRQDRYDVGVLVADLLAVMDACGVEKASVVGQSMGGWTALGLTLRAPERVRALVLADTVAGISDAEIVAHHTAMLANARKLGATPPPLARHPALSPEFCAANPAEAYLYQTLASFGAPTPASIAGQLSTTRFDNAQLARLKIPTLFVVGRSDTVFPPALIRRAATHVPGARVVEIDGAGHSPYFEQPERWNDAVGGFLGAAAQR